MLAEVQRLSCAAFFALDLYSMGSYESGVAVSHRRGELNVELPMLAQSYASYLIVSSMRKSVGEVSGCLFP